MTVMTTEVTGLPPRRPFTRADLEFMPDDGHRYEIVDGTLLVSAAPQTAHQRVVWNLVLLLDPVMPPGLEPFSAPVDVVLAEDTVLQPDVVIGRVDDVTATAIEAAPVLAIEVLSPSTRTIDLTLKKQRLEQAGCGHYWVIDPDPPSLTAWELVDGAYVETGRADGEEVLALERPFPIEVVPAALTRR